MDIEKYVQARYQHQYEYTISFWLEVITLLVDSGYLILTRKYIINLLRVWKRSSLMKIKYDKKRRYCFKYGTSILLIEKVSLSNSHRRADGRQFEASLD